MADVQIDDGQFTQIANVLLEKVSSAKLNGCQNAIILVIWRYTYGFKRKEHMLSSGFIANATGYNKRQIEREINKLIERNMISQKIINGVSRTISFNKNYDSWDSTPGKLADGQKADGKYADGVIADPTPGESADGTPGELADQEINLLNKSLNKVVVEDDPIYLAGLVEKNFCKKRNKGLQVSSNDFELIKEMIAVKIPVEFINSIVDRCFDEYEPKHRHDEIRSISFCTPRIYDEWYRDQNRNKPAEVRPFEPKSAKPRQKQTSYNQKPIIPIATTDPGQAVSEEEFQRMLEEARQMKANKEKPGA
jgi:phage replication O-like protein O